MYIILSVAIPTFNRASLLQNNLKKMLKSPRADFEIVVTDNSDNDLTGDVIKEFVDHRLIYHRNDSNIGAVKNIVYSLTKCSGKYVCFLSDEDYLNIDLIIDKILINKNNVGVVLGTTENEFGIKINKRQNRTYQFPLALYEFFNNETYLSGITIKKEFVNMDDLDFQLSQKDNGYLDAYPHTYIVNKILLTKKTVFTFGETVIAKGPLGTVNLHGVENYYTPENILNRFNKLGNLLEVNYDKDIKYNILIKKLMILYVLKVSHFRLTLLSNQPGYHIDTESHLENYKNYDYKRDYWSYGSNLKKHFFLRLSLIERIQFLIIFININAFNLIYYYYHLIKIKITNIHKE